MVELQINVDSIRTSKSGGITGILFLRINNLIFPEDSWNDFIAVVLGFWVSEVLKNWNLDILGDFRFMDGPIRFQIAKIGNKTEFTGFNDEKLILQEEIDYSSFKNSVIDIAFKVVSIAEEKKWESKDIDFLKDQLKDIRIMLTERDLLTDIILYAPESSIWNISSDSWERIPHIFSSFISNNQMYGWDVAINNDNRNQLVDIVASEDLFEKIVHQYIKFNDEIIFESYDRMTGSYISPHFPKFDKLILKYQNSDFDVLELKSE